MTETRRSIFQFLVQFNKLYEQNIIIKIAIFR